jgi:1-acyl-sn-glycerol-3-phosphate acyltransferase
MIRALQQTRSAASLVLVLLWILVVGSILVYPVVLPLCLLIRRRRRAVVSVFMKFMAGGIFALLRLGGGRFEWQGSLPTAQPCLILMNHQSLLDILTATLLGRPYVPAFVPRRRYAHWYLPVISASIWLLECPVVDPRRDARAAVEAMRRAGEEQRHGLLVFPEGHRSVDGAVRPFRTAGTRAVLEARRVPVYAVVTDGYWFGRRLGDFLGNVGRIRGRSEVLGPFMPPEGQDEIEAFIGRMRDTIASHLEGMRRATRAEGA